MKNEKQSMYTGEPPPNGLSEKPLITRTPAAC